MSRYGVIKSFKPKEGFGFISYSDGEIFFHINDVIDRSDRDRIAVGLQVEFEVGEGRKGKPAAKNVRIRTQSIEQNPPTPNNNSKISYFLPHDTMTIIPDQLDKIDNFSLLFNKLPYFEDDNFIFYKRDRKGNDIINLADKFRISEQLIKNLSERQKATIIKFLGNNNIKTSIFSPDWRLIVGIGHESVYEVSITLHHIYGIPYIPGQAVKGVTRSFIITEIFRQDEKEALKDVLFCYIFGSPKEGAIGEHIGSVIFFDAFSTTVPKLEVDIMNPHYSDYYQGKTPPADYLNPNPIPFLTVGKDTEFEFIVGMKKPLNLKSEEMQEIKKSPLIKGCKTLPENPTPLDVAAEWLKKALSDHGIGAKTAVGYGYFEQQGENK